jgi:hypothetical protein
LSLNICSERSSALPSLTASLVLLVWFVTLNPRYKTHVDREGWGVVEINLWVAFHVRSVGVHPGAVRLRACVGLLELSLVAAFSLGSL